MWWVLALALDWLSSRANNVKGGRRNTFRDYTSLASITIPESVTQIDKHTFEGCTSLASITLPAVFALDR